MPDVASSGRVSLYLALGTCAALVIYALAGESSDSPPAPQSVAVQERGVVPATVVAAPSLEVEPEEEEIVEEEPEEVRGHAPIEDPAEFAFTFSVDGVEYIRLSTDERAEVHGKQRLIEGDEVAVVASVETSAMPADLRAWAGRQVLVDGVCPARVVGFAEVSRVSGDPPGSGDRYYDEESDEETEPTEEPRWTIESVTDDNVLLAGRLDGCSGSWARATSYPAVAVAAPVEEPALETAARANLLARSADDPIQISWKADGGEGDWRDAAEVVSHVYEHELTHERWVFVQARRAGGCGDPGIEVMAAYRAKDDGSVRRVADLSSYALRDLQDVVDLDGDGQPELVMGTGTGLDLVDLASESHSSISVSYHSYGCGC